MRIKSYYARAVEDAVGQARAELGPEAMIVNSRKAPPEARHLGEYEAVCALGEEPAGAADAARPAPAGDRLTSEVAELRKQMEGMRRTLTRSALPSAPWCPESSAAYALLTANDVSAEVARDLVAAAELRALGARAGAGTPAPVEARDFQRALVEEMTSRCAVQPTLGRGRSPAVTALVGPPGAGKTSTLVKLAVHYGLTGRRPVALVSADTYRVAAAEQLRSYAAILGVTLLVAETAAALAQCLEELKSKDLVLIDTPGLSAADMDHGADLARFLATREDIDTHLVLTASMKSADLTRMIDAYERFRPQHLLFTRLDETGSFGPIFNEAVRTGKPLSFFATGQRIPEDLEAASREKLIGLVTAGGSGEALSAA